MKKHIALIAVLVAAVAVAGSSLYYGGCSDSCGVAGPTVLPGSEVTEYQGTDLSSIAGFRENSIKGPQYVNLEEYTLEVTGLVNSEKQYNIDELLGDFQSYEKVVTLNCVEGWSVTILWEGLLAEEVISEAGALPEANTVIFHAYDGYTTSLPLDYVMDNDLLLAHKMNGLDLSPERGAPLQLVAESKWGYKWIKWVTEIELSDDTEYEGFWESRGYSNNADYGEPFFD